MKQDFLGQEIREGDIVVSHFGGGYAGLSWATVVGFTPKMIKLLIKTRTGENKFNRYGADLVVLSEEQKHHLTFKLLKK